MKPYGEGISTVLMQVAGLRGAVERLEAAVGRKDDAQGTYIPLFEALNWIASLDDRIGTHWRPSSSEKLENKWRDKVSHGAVIAAVDWVRNVVHHQWADALRLDPSGYGLQLSPNLYLSPDLLLRADHAWVWRDASELPKRRERRKKNQAEGEDGAALYLAQLQGRPADETLRMLLPDFEFVASLLEPPHPEGIG